MAEQKTAHFQFGLKGLTSKTNPSLLTDGQYRSMSNCEILLEGALSSRAGAQSVAGSGGPTTQLSCYQIQKMVVSANTEAPNVPATNPRYVGLGGGAGYNLYRTPDYSTFTEVAASINTANGQYFKAFSLAVYTAGEIGGPWAFIASELKMLKDSGVAPFSTLELWGILPAFGVATAVSSGPSTGVLDGGSSSSPGQSTAYDWRYTYQNTQTMFEGNPSQIMLVDSTAGGARPTLGVPSDGTPQGTPIEVHLESVVVTVYGTNDPQIANINIYRRGGLLYDTWRLVGTVTNPGLGSPATFTDNISDTDLVDGVQITLDNDPPVDSAPQTPITGTISGAIAAGFQTVHLSIGTTTGITPGSLMHFFYNAPEDVIVQSIPSSSSFVAYFQHAHTGFVGPVDFEVDTITGQSCNLAIAYQQFILVAGDPNNPHLIYRSKGGVPEAFPVVPADGSIATCACGSPSNGIVNMFEYRGQVLTLNLYGLFETLLLNGSFIPANQVAYRGLVAMRACCKTDIEVWFLSTDGIYSWDGGSCRKRSEAIDPIFHGQEINGFLPLSYVQSSLEQCVLEFRRGLIYFLYPAGSTPQELICDPNGGDRWYLSNPGPTPPLFIYTERDTGSMIEAAGNASNVTFQITDQNVVYSGVNYTADGFTITGSPPPAITGGSPITFDVRLPWFDFATPAVEKVFEEVFLEIDTTASAGSGGSSLAIDLLYDFSDTVVASDTATIITTTSGRHLVSILNALQSVSTVIQSYGREARAISFHIYGSAYPTRMTLYSLVFVYQEETMLTAGGASDWQTLGGSFDVRIYQMTVEFDTAGVNQTIALDTVTGIGAGTVALAAQTFTLNNPTTSGPGRAKQTFPLADETIVKLIRVRPYATAAAVGDSSAAFFKVFSVTFPVIEQFPPDVVTTTPWKDAQVITDQNPSWLGIDADTGGVGATVNLQNENGTVLTVTHTGTVGNRRANYPIPVDLFAKMWRLLSSAGSNGKFQLFTFQFTRWQPTALESGVQPPDTVTWLPWRDASSPTDKNPTWLWIDAFTNAIAASVELVNEVGVVMTVSHTGTTDNRRFNYPIPVDQLAKMWRLIIAPGGGGTFQCWNWGFQRWEPTALTSGIDPPEQILWTPWWSGDYPFDKLARSLTLTINTNGVACTVNLQTQEAGTVQNFSVTTTYTTRRIVLTCNPNLAGKLWRLTFVPGSGGYSMLWDWTLDTVKEPPALSTWTSYQQSLGYFAFKFLKQCFLEYVSPVTINVTFVSSTGTFTINLPIHATRAVERFYFPTVFGGGLCKSVLYDISITASDGTSGVALYGDASTIEWIACGSDRHSAYQKTKLSTFMQIPI